MAEEDKSEEHVEPVDSDDEDIDPELLELAEPRRRKSILRPILFVAVIWFGISIISDWRPELEYFMSSSEPVEIGSVQDFPEKRAEDEGWKPELPHNRYVAIEGIPSRRAESERYRFFKLIGGDIFVEVPKDGEQDPYEDMKEKAPDPTRNDRSYYRGAGRALQMSDVSDRYNGVRSFYLKNYNIRLCGGSEKFQELASKMVPDCTEGWLIQGTRTPGSFWWYAALAGLIGLFVVLNIYWLGRWIYDFFRS
ncbi:MAG: hypothetical protein ACQEVA_16210 [Myxococcota bacterium]